MHFRTALKYRILGILFITVLLAACKTTKNTFVNRAYHNTTTRYNWYFNAHENYKSGVKTLSQQHKDDYNQLLSVFPLGTKTEAQSIAPQMDKALKKCAQAISKHSMLIKGTEHNRWIDEAYLLIGKSYFYKHEYIKAVEAFRLVSRQFSGTMPAYEALVWQLTSYVQMKDFSSANLTIESILLDDTFPSALNKDLSLALAHYYLAVEDDSSALEELNQAIQLTKKKREKSRYLYLVAQLYSKQANYSMATDYFSKVIRTSPDYEMVFNAKINRARSFDTSSGGSEQIREELQKMLKDDKNQEFLDVIYFGLAELSNRQGLIKEALPLYALSVAKSVSNNAQKALSSIILADLHYDQQNYRPAQAYYDTAVAYMNTENSSYKGALAKQNTLLELISNLDIIQEQDSLQRIALMPEVQRNAFIDQLIQQVKEKELAQKRLENEGRLEDNFFNDPNQNINRFNNNQNRGVGWYFDNPNTLSFGFSEFNRKWGKRKLEDDWRRSNKKTLSVEEALADTIDSEAFDPTSRASYIKNLPLTTQDVQQSNNRIIEAYFDAGVIYKEKLNDLNQALITFEALNSRFPLNSNRVMVLYFLYRIHQEKGTLDFANDYKNQLINEFPNSDYAKLINDPSYAQELALSSSNLEMQYEQAYKLYLQSKFIDCISFCQNINANKPNNPLFAHFDFLKTMAQGYDMTKEQYLTALQLIVEKHPKHSVAQSAQEIITFLNNQPLNQKDGADWSGDSPYQYNPQAAHYFILLFNDFDLELSIAKSTLSDYHAEYYRLERLNISSLLFSEHIQMINIREFSNAQKAMDYYNAFQSGDVRGVFGSDYTAFIIAGPNFPYFFKNKDTEGYSKMFQQYYK